MSYFLSFAVILSSLCNWKGAQSYKKLPEAIVPKLGHGPKMGQFGFDRACVSVVFLFLLCFIAYLYEANGGTDMEVLACFRPGFLFILRNFWIRNNLWKVSPRTFIKGSNERSGKKKRHRNGLNCVVFNLIRLHSKIWPPAKFEFLIAGVQVFSCSCIAFTGLKMFLSKNYVELKICCSYFTSMSMEVLPSWKKSTSRYVRICDVQPSKRRGKWFWTTRLCVCLSICPSVRLSVWPSVLLSLFPRALTGVRFNRSSWNFTSMFGYMGHCAVPVFEAIREPVYKII